MFSKIWCGLRTLLSVKVWALRAYRALGVWCLLLLREAWMMERGGGNLITGWWELVEDWGTLGQRYHCTPFSNVIIFAAEVNL